jgi:hypothetical protein
MLSLKSIFNTRPNALKAMAIATLAVSSLSAALPAMAEGRFRGSVNIHVGGPHGGSRWHSGHWHHGWYGPRIGWWWVVGPSWSYYPEPVYPYPPLMVEQVAPVETAALGPAPQQSWYYCDAAKAYYPYVSTCPGGWKAVPVAPTTAPLQ